jgi:hypothetical protein
MEPGERGLAWTFEDDPGLMKKPVESISSLPSAGLRAVLSAQADGEFSHGLCYLPTILPQFRSQPSCTF